MLVTLGDLINLIDKLNRKDRSRSLFFNYSGHVNTFDITIYKNGWKENKENDFHETYINDSEGIYKAYTEVCENV